MPRVKVKDGACGDEAGVTCACARERAHEGAHRCGCGGQWEFRGSRIVTVMSPPYPGISGWGDRATKDK